MREFLAEADKLLLQQGTSAKLHELKSHAYESLMEFRAAINELDLAISIAGKPANKQLKRRARLLEYAEKWEKLPLSPRQLKALERFLNPFVEFDDTEIDDRFKYTREWLSSRHCNVEVILDKFRAMGYRSDFDIVFNLCREG